MSEEPAAMRRTDRVSPDEIDLMEDLQHLHRPIAGDVPLSEIINPLVREGELYEKLPGEAVHCFACGHNCKINPGKRGICQVRYNINGKLYVPWGYVAALQCDPTEKKPFFHVYPGSDTLTFGMLGCDLHCSYCFVGETQVVTEHGPMTMVELFQSAPRCEHRPDGEVAYPDGLSAVAASGKLRKIRAAFKHPYRGQLTVLRPYYLPAVRCTPDHLVYATSDVSRRPEPTPARQLTTDHYLAIPRQYHFTAIQEINVLEELCDHRVTYRVPWRLSKEDRDVITSATKRGETSRQIGAALGKDPSYIRHIRSKLAHGQIEAARTSGPLVENGRLRFPNEHRPGIPASIPINASIGRLLGLYCAEGSVRRYENRPNSLNIDFSFSHSERNLAEETRRLLKDCLDIDAGFPQRSTTLAVTVGKSSAALLFEALAGSGAREKRVPQAIFNAPAPVVKAFLDAYVEGDGHRGLNGKVSATTVSLELAYGIAWLALRLGYLPSIYDNPMQEQGQIMGRQVNRSPHQYTIVWYEGTSITRKVVETEDYYLVPLRSISSTEYEGDVFNMEVEEEHNYLAGFFLVSNCQNWDISQALRDANAGRPPAEVTPQELVRMAVQNGARCAASSYNEPLITSEWAAAVFREAKAAGLTCMYVSNGNATREVLEYIRPFTDGYKIDLKTMNGRNYRKLGAVLENVLDGVRMVHEMGFWLEIVTLIVPGFNDSDQELREAARFIKSLSADIPWHVTAFHKDYRMTDPQDTSVRTLLRAAELGCEEGLHYVYAGNRPGEVGRYENTRCPSCGETLIERYGYIIQGYHLTAEGTCPKCRTAIPGIWTDKPERVRIGGPGMPRWVVRR